MGNIIIKKEENTNKIKKRMQNELKSLKAFDPKKFIGKLKLKEEPLAYQKRIRKGWDEHIN